MISVKPPSLESFTSKLSINELNQRLEKRGSMEIETIKSQKRKQLRQEGDVVKTYADLLAEYRGQGRLWEDPDFPADSSSVFVSRQSKDYKEFVWKRPNEITQNPKLFTAGVSRFDVQQGGLGDCWFLAVIATLSLNEPLFRNVVPDDQDFEENYIGAFRFRFWLFGKWCDIIVDDRLPTFQGRLVYLHSTQTNEYWSALLEKAYAKAYGKYESLVGGSQSEAMEDVTGGLCETIMLNPKTIPPNLYQYMRKLSSQSSLLGCGLDGSGSVLTSGLATGHAYSITDVEQVTQTNGQRANLLRIRNPWGNDTEWKGRWSDKSREWDTISAENKQRLYVIFSNDGEFWMDFEDFVTNFSSLEICHLGPESLDGDLGSKKKWEMSLELGSWSKNFNAGGCRNYLDSFVMNPQYKIEVVDADRNDNDDMGTVIVGLMQKGMRKRNLRFFSIGYAIYKLDNPKAERLDKAYFKYNGAVAQSSSFVNTREICERHTLQKGFYMIIPSTFNPNEETAFILRIFTQKPNRTKELDVKNSRIPMTALLKSKPIEEKMDIIEQKLEELFKKISKPSGTINANKLRYILNIAKGNDLKTFDGFDLEVCRSMVALYDHNYTGKIEYQEFLTLFRNIKDWKAVFKEFDINGNGEISAFAFRNSLNKCGFNVSNSLFKVLTNRYSDHEKVIITFQDFIMAVIRLNNSFETMELQPKNDEMQLLFRREEFMVNILYI